MRTIYKYPIGVSDGITPVRGSVHDKVILVDQQNGQLTVWMEVETEVSPMDIRRFDFFIRGTGHPIPDGAEHVGSVVMVPFVWHVYLMPQ